MRDLTDDVALMRPVIDALRASGTDPDRVLVRVGLPPGGLPAGRFPHAAQAAFWKAASEECGAEHVGLYLAQHLPAFHGLLLEYLFLSSETFGLACATRCATCACSPTPSARVWTWTAIWPC